MYLWRMKPAAAPPEAETPPLELAPSALLSPPPPGEIFKEALHAVLQALEERGGFDLTKQQLITLRKFDESGSRSCIKKRTRSQSRILKGK